MKNKNDLIPVTGKAIEWLALSLAALPIVFFFKYTQDIFILPKEMVFQSLVLLLLIFWIIKAGKEKVSFVKSPLNNFVLLFLAINLLSLSWSTNFQLSLREINRLAFRVVFYFLLINSIKSEKQISRAVDLLILAAGFESMYGLIQHFKLDPFLGLQLEGKMNIIGTLGYHNYLAEWLVLIFPLIINKLLFGTDKPGRILTFIILLTSMSCIILTRTRSAWLAMSFSIPFYLIFTAIMNKEKLIRYKKQLITISLIIAVLGTFLVFIPRGRNSSSVAGRIKSTLDLRKGTIKSRIVIWKTCLGMIKRKPLQGWGLGTFKYHYLDFLPEGRSHLAPAEYVSEEAEHVHNDLLEAWVETGVFGFISFGLIIVFFIRRAIITAVKGRGSMSMLSIAFSAGIAGIFIDSLFSFPFHIMPINVTAWYIMGLLVVSGKINGKENN